MSEEKKNSEEKDTNQPNDQNNQDERKQQFEKMRERFSQKKGPGPLGGGGPKNSFNFYWIYAIVVVGLLAFTMFGGGFGNARTSALTQSQFDQMLSKGWVSTIKIINEEFAEIYIKKDSLSKIVDASNKQLFPNEHPGPQYHLIFASQDFFMGQIKEDQKNIAENEKEWPLA